MDFILAIPGLTFIALFDVLITFQGLESADLKTTKSVRKNVKREAKTRHEVSFFPALLKTLDDNLKQQPVYHDSPKGALSDLCLEIKLAIPFTSNQDPQGIPKKLQLGEILHYHPSERSHCELHRHTSGHIDQGFHPDISHQSEFLPGTHAGQYDIRVRSLPKPLFHHLGNCYFQQCWIEDIWSSRCADVMNCSPM
ncbi:uncharacterized protein TNCV_414151 [Trichonephila clavipes]|nr:uncharacterized protein TNCV_414151 [Trichonephila clavipes]